MKSEPSSQESATHSPRLTRNQQAVLDLLYQQADALSAQELYSLLRQRQAVGLATIYRALETLKLRGLDLLHKSKIYCLLLGFSPIT